MGITAYLPVYWLIALVVFLVIEAATLGLATIWFAGGALVALIAAMCGRVKNRSTSDTTRNSTI